ncbi:MULTISPECIES: sensor domain-containing diguanylate cyclase [unclassified Herbaspirillum]|uniref:sensor domain-containing diguanylate cyclase n=1 Tax=unclassified Herbaspirillum TaxID=2624150 RepID=UPI0011525601|nr:MULTISPECIES: sensor domain-containing diguanylate cyclase [unclassified Herbaspirillum]MBB5392179.1 diguanylate cyclase (GGDEF)-like protein [Herbaspirillum sp. SJZ102]TQK13636.1 diguanylate cyclase (GGDEF)-like protein [Herbaspirillum sp. SJZ130]TQK15639.1 diguanylate cyclase (GGDEF)-like protein [Herbaspirillum sp. SJZ106]TWC71538.1 diguanylate cyclase (GGDEF)-like protein [Herbaspirillum sp. SJZ099]
MQNDHSSSASPASRNPAQALSEQETFDLTPVSLWKEDYSGMKRLFDEWRAQGVTDLQAYLKEDITRAQACARQIRVVDVNRRTLEWYEARDLEHLVANLDKVFRDDMIDTFIDELAQLWEGKLNFSSYTVNYTLGGKRLDIQLSGRIMPGSEESWDYILLAIENVTERETARKKLSRSENYARGLFEYSPISLWVEDFSQVKRLFDDLHRIGITDFRTFTDVHPEFVERCAQEIRVIDVNLQTLSMFGAPDKATLLSRLSDIFRDDMHHHFNEQLLELWNGNLFHQREVVNYSLNGDQLYVHLQFSVFPGYEDSWGLVLVALTDITARKKAEAYLEFLGKHDELTKLYNRAYMVEELNRLERKGPFPVSVIVADLNGLKQVNDELGHAAGDALLRRVGEVLAKAVDRPGSVARTGGDEFAILLPATDERNCAALLEHIQKLVDLNNQFYSGITLSLSIGAVTSMPGERLEHAVQRADALMYEAKRQYYAGTPGLERRQQPD